MRTEPSRLASARLRRKALGGARLGSSRPHLAAGVRGCTLSLVLLFFQSGAAHERVGAAVLAHPEPRKRLANERFISDFNLRAQKKIFLT